MEMLISELSKLVEVSDQQPRRRTPLGLGDAVIVLAVPLANDDKVKIARAQKRRVQLAKMHHNTAVEAQRQRFAPLVAPALQRILAAPRPRNTLVRDSETTGSFPRRGSSLSNQYQNPMRFQDQYLALHDHYCRASHPKTMAHKEMLRTSETTSQHSTKQFLVFSLEETVQSQREEQESPFLSKLKRQRASGGTSRIATLQTGSWRTSTEGMRNMALLKQQQAEQL